MSIITIKAREANVTTNFSKQQTGKEKEKKKVDNMAHSNGIDWNQVSGLG
jgi:hypothetical protein